MGKGVGPPRAQLIPMLTTAEERVMRAGMRGNGVNAQLSMGMGLDPGEGGGGDCCRYCEAELRQGIKRDGVHVPLQMAAPMVHGPLGNPTGVCPMVCRNISSVQASIHQVVAVPMRVQEVHVLGCDVQVCPG